MRFCFYPDLVTIELGPIFAIDPGGAVMQLEHRKRRINISKIG